MSHFSFNPHFVLALLSLTVASAWFTGSHAADDSSVEVLESEIEFVQSSVRAIRDIECSANPRAKELLCSSSVRRTLWVFTLPGHFAHPAVVERTMLVQEPGSHNSTQSKRESGTQGHKRQDRQRSHRTLGADWLELPHVDMLLIAPVAVFVWRASHFVRKIRSVS
jgi:hypothetical protein